MESVPLPTLVTSAARRLSLFLKIAGICLLIGLLHIPLLMTHGVLRERQGYQEQATREIAAVWGQRQLVTGPVLAVTYSYKAQVIRSRIVNGRKVDVPSFAVKANDVIEVRATAVSRQLANKGLEQLDLVY